MKVPFGYHFQSQRFVGIDEVENGLKCGCVCPSCNMLLVARQGEENEHHFAHHEKAKEECEFSYWVAIRSMAKQIIDENKSIAAEYEGVFPFTQVPFKNNANIKIFHASLTPRVPSFQFDAKLITTHGVFYVYFLTGNDDTGRVKHHRDLVDKQCLFLPFRVLEVDLRPISRVSTKKVTEGLEELLITPTVNNKKWVLPKVPYTIILESLEESNSDPNTTLEEYLPPPTKISSKKSKIKMKKVAWPIVMHGDGYMVQLLKFYNENFEKYKNNIPQYTNFRTLFKKEYPNWYFVWCNGDFFGMVSFADKHYAYSVENNKVTPLPIEELSIEKAQNALRILIQHRVEKLF